ncbi:MAG TPA: c-type cytochrome [Chryseolinea sp.]|nr:c-type cytochrome [Chryseolinea sp.]
MKKILILVLTTSAVLVLSTCSQPDKSAVVEETGFDTPRVVKADATPGFMTAEESLKSFRVPKGYHMELVADESMLSEPVAISWDGNGRMFVTQMETYMQTVDTTGEHKPSSRIMLLEDTNDDGKMDKSSVFIDKLMLPRMILSVGHELLVNETDTYDMFAYKDSNNDGVADEKRNVYHTDKKAFGNLEHQRSGLDWNLDNWIYITVDPIRFQYREGKLHPDTLISGSNGQWGLTHDDYGRLFYSRAGAENAGSGFHINPVYGQLEFADAYNDSTFGAVWPIIKTPDIQGGIKRIREDTTLNHFTAANGQSIFRGNHLPSTLVGDYLIDEPVARIIRRAKVINTDGKRTLKNAYEQEEFISSSDMNFRPVNTYTGPDGCLYIVDMNRGIIQEGTWTGEGSYLRKQILRLGLDKNVQHGRIWRLVYDGMGRGNKPKMLDETTRQLVSHLDHPNGWWRDNAQKEIVLRNDKSVVADLKLIAAGKKGPLNPSPLARIHALWTLSGLRSNDKAVLLDAIHDADAGVRKTAVWISEEYIMNDDHDILDALEGLKDDNDYDVRIQLLLSLSKGKSQQAKAISDNIIKASAGNEMIAAVQKSLNKTDDIRKLGSKMGSLNPEGRQLITDGSAIFKSLCATCHGADGKGVPTNLAPPLAGNFRRYIGNKNALIRILLNGLTGPVNGKTYSENMTSMAMNDDKWIASVLSYLRYDIGLSERAFPGTVGEDFANRLLVKPEEVKKLRDESKGRTKPWTWEELMTIQPNQ